LAFVVFTIFILFIIPRKQFVRQTNFVFSAFFLFSISFMFLVFLVSMQRYLQTLTLKNLTKPEIFLYRAFPRIIEFILFLAVKFKLLISRFNSLK